MTTSDPDDLDLIAAEYVLGTLSPEAARVFQQHLAEDEATRACLRLWEQRLAQLALELDPVEPPAQLWKTIAQELGIEVASGARGPAAPAPDSGPARGLRRWRRLAIAASVCALVLAGLAIVELPVWQAGPQAPDYAGVIYDQTSGMSWLVTSIGHGSKLSVDAMGDFQVPSHKMLRMWLKPANGKPHLIGRLPHTRGHYTMALSETLRASLGGHSKIMVSMEDRSRAGTQTPGGKLMWVSPLAHREG